MGATLRKLWIVAAAFALCSIGYAQGIRLSAQQIWSGISTYEANPYYANIENNGPNDNVILTANSQESPSNIEYPIELPTGSHKRVLFLTGGWSDGKIYLRTSSGIKDATIKNGANGEQTKYGLISDHPSDLIFMKGQSDGTPNSGAIGVGGCSPDDAPDRSLGYDCLDALVLGDGTEKLRDEQVAAIKQYVQQGGVLMFVGGAATSASSDPRWRDLIPFANATVVTRNGLTERTGSAAPGSFPVAIKHGVCFTKGYGLGIVSMLTVNPFESPVREADDRRSMLSRAMPRNRHKQVRDLLRQQIGSNDYQDYRYPVAATTAAPPAIYTASGTPAVTIKPGRASAMYPSNPIIDPFEIKPPSVVSIMWILIAYAIVVVPINFLVLRKMNRLEIAWISTPIISVVFSMILLNSTIGLYKSTATTRTTAIAVLGSKGQDSLIFGRSEMFFPRAKSYDLQLNNVESVLVGRNYSEGDSGGVSLIDDGRHIIAPSVGTGNLAFKELSYMQSSNELAGLSITLEKSGGKTLVRIQNHSRANLSSVSLYGPGLTRSITDPIKAGATITEPVSDIIQSKTKTKDDNTIGWQYVANASPTKIVVIGTLDSMKAGPGYGAGHPASRYMLVTTPEWSETQ